MKKGLEKWYYNSMKKKISGLLLLLFIYLTAFFVGFLVFTLISKVIDHIIINLLIADVAATIYVFIASIVFRTASVYDPYWSVQPPVILVAFAVGKQITPLRILLLVAVLFWAIRLTANWAYTFKGLDHQDWRYTMLKEKTKFFYPIVNFVGIHMVPTLIVYACILPAVWRSWCRGHRSSGHRSP